MSDSSLRVSSVGQQFCNYEDTQVESIQTMVSIQTNTVSARAEEPLLCTLFSIVSPIPLVLTRRCHGTVTSDAAGA